jgi:hypothetical protein
LLFYYYLLSIFFGFTKKWIYLLGNNKEMTERGMFNCVKSLDLPTKRMKDKVIKNDKQEDIHNF